MNIIQLAAGVGSRLGKPFPKPLTPLSNGETILARQQRLLLDSFPEARPTLVVGFKKAMLMEEFPDSVFVYNSNFGETNTSKSLLRGLKASGQDPVLWLNGDVVFDAGLVGLVSEAVLANESFVCVNTAKVGPEEVKYTVDGDGYIAELSKTVRRPLGEAVGINYVTGADKAALIEHLEMCDDNDYFERGIETAVAAGQARFKPIDISEFPCIEIDFKEDLERALETFS